MFPEPFVVGVRKRSLVHDGMAQVESWGPVVSVPVFGWGPPAPDEAVRAEQSGVEHVLDVYCAESPTTHRDMVLINGVEFYAIGEPDDYRFGPFSYRPGVRVRLSRVVG